MSKRQRRGRDWMIQRLRWMVNLKDRQMKTISRIILRHNAQLNEEVVVVRKKVKILQGLLLLKTIKNGEVES